MRLSSITFLFLSITSNDGKTTIDIHRLGSCSPHITGLPLCMIKISHGCFLLLSPRQIVSIQTLHYLTMALLIPPLLAIFAEPAALSYAGGSANVGLYTFCIYIIFVYNKSSCRSVTGMIMDWREMAGRPTARIPREHDGGWSAWNAVWSGVARAESAGAGKRVDGLTQHHRSLTSNHQHLDGRLSLIVTIISQTPLMSFIHMSRST